MAVPHGKNTVFKLDNAAGSIVDLSAYLDSVRFPREVDTPETTTFNAAGVRSYIVGLIDSTITIGGPWDPTVDAHLAGILGSDTTKTFEYGPEGGTGGDVQYSGECILTKYDPDSPVDDAARFTAEFQVTGAVTRDTTWT